MNHPLDALESSVAYLRALIEGLDESQYVASAHPTEWTVADTMSHLGSGAVIMKRRFEDVVAGKETPPEFNQSVERQDPARPGDRRTRRRSGVP
jgi:hypothetical protein